MKTSILDHAEEGAERRDTLAGLIADGVSNAEIANAFSVNRWTITQWKKRSDVAALVTEKLRLKANKIRSKVDTRIEKILENEEELRKVPVNVLLDIRRTYSPKDLNVNLQGDAAKATEDLMLKLHANPELAAAFGEAAASSDADG